LWVFATDEASRQIKKPIMEKNMFKLTKKIKDHLAKAVITPLSLTVLAFFAGQAFKTGNLWLAGIGVLLFLEMQALAIALLYEGEENTD
jgi:hypothetical protein